MKKGGSRSSLNPYAESYIPLFKRPGANVNKDFSSTQERNRGNEAVWFGHRPENVLPQGQHRNVSQKDDTMLSTDSSKWKDRHGGEYLNPTSQYANEMPEKPNFDEDMDLAYLQMTFPEISYESLYGVYLTNKCDLDAAVEMINQLEIQPIESSGKLPDSLDIGDVPESGPINNAAASASTSGPTH